MATYVHRLPSPWGQLLAGVGFGLGRGVEERLDRRDRRKSMIGQILEGIMSGEYDPRMFATDEGKDFLRQAGIDQEPEIRKIVGRGAVRSGQLDDLILPGIHGTGGNFPKPKPFSAEELGRTRARETFDAKVAERRALARAEADERKAAEPTADERVEDAVRVATAGARLGLPPQNINVGGVNFLTPDELGRREAADRKTAADKAEGERKSLDQWDIEYHESVRMGEAYRTDMIKSVLAAQKTGNLGGILGLMGLSLPVAPTVETKFKNSTPEEKVRILIREGNRNIDARNEEIKAKARRARVNPKEIALLPRLTEEDFLSPEEPKPGEEPGREAGGAATPAQTRSALTAPGAKEPRREDPREIEATARMIFDRARANGKPITWSYARDLAREFRGRNGNANR